MTTIFRKEVDADGNETYVEVRLTEVELPDDHPLVAELNSTKQESIKRRKELQKLKKQIEQAEASEDGATPEPEPTEARETTPAINVDEIVVRTAELTRKQLLEEQRQAQEAEQSRKAAIDGILKETGLNETYRPVIEAIPDLNDAKAKAAFLAEKVNRFDNVGGGNGGRDASAMLKRTQQLLGLPDTP